MKKVILFIEDDLPTIEVYKTALEEANFDVGPILLGEEAIRRIREINQGVLKKPDLVLLDLILPDINGIDILEEMRKHKKTKNLRVFILTNYTDKKLEEKGIYFKAEKYLLKTDYVPRELAKLIKEQFKK